MNTVIILAGGNGTRMEALNFPKQYLLVEGKMIIEYCIDIYAKIDIIDKIVVVVDKTNIVKVRGIVAKYDKDIDVVEGGTSRMLSAYNAVMYLDNICTDEDKIIITDGVRPCTLKSEVLYMIESLENYDCVTSGIECYETLLRADDNSEIYDIIPRENMYRQTSPEGYKLGILKRLYINEDLSVIEAYKNIGVDQLISKGGKVKLVRCSSLNIKITKREDIALFESIIKSNLLENISSSMI